MKKSTLTLTSLLLGATIFSANAKAECGDVTISEMGWASGQLVTSIAKFFLEQGYKCSVQTVPTATVPALTSVAETGKPDIVTELWLNSVYPVYDKLLKQGKVITATHVLSDGGIDGWWIPKYLADKHPELKTIEGVLAHPELVGGRFNNAPDGWGLRTINDNLIKAFDFSKSDMKVFNHGSGETLAASLASAYDSKKPWFGYYWAPTSVLGKYDMVAVDMGSFNQEAYECAKSKECINPQKTSLAKAEVITAVTSNLAERAPEVLELMKNISFTNEQMSGLLAWEELNKATADETAVHFIQTQSAIWSKWLNNDARENLASLIK
ncbi:MAG: ABC transporter substrate-binding protein [Marinomonas sp.]|jgi:glycine betaine/proline transport system substrate-binding protein